MTLPLFDSPALMQGKPPKSLRPYQARAVRDVRALVLMGKAPHPLPSGGR